ncbi:MAG TPA: M1 family aminopeptidase [bacterium]|nr:M1 family aminopeptidase [bacterium]
MNKQRCLVLLVFFCFVVHLSRSRADTDDRLAGMDVLHYEIFLDLEFTRQFLTGCVEVRFLPPLDPNLPIAFDLLDLTVDSVRVENQKIPFYRSQTRIELARSALAGDTLSACIYYSGNPGNSGRGGFFWRQGYAYTIGEAINLNDPSALKFWLPANDRPDDKATCAIELRVPVGCRAVANGSLVSVVQQSSHTVYRWHEKHPIAPYLIAVAAGPFVMLAEKMVSCNGDTLPLTCYVFPDAVEKARANWLGVLPPMVQFLESRFGPYPFTGYAMVQLPDFGGAMEHQQISFFSASLLTDDNRYESIVLHELAHQWWGDWVTLSDWKEIWLNEGFASYCEILYIEAMYGDSARNAALDQFSTAYFDETSRRGHFSIYAPVYAWGGTVYKKGAWILHMLRRRLGDQVFFAAMNAYGQRFAYRNSTIRGFQTVVEEISGENLEVFFQEWIYGSGYPQLRFAWSFNPLPYEGYKIELTVKQVQTQTVFHQPVPVGWTAETDTLMDRFDLQGLETVHSVTWHRAPHKLLIDPDRDLLKKAAVVSAPLPDGVVSDDLYLSQNHPNPYVWSYADKTRIGLQIPAAQTPAKVVLQLFDISGRRVRILLQKTLAPGYYQVEWDGRDDLGGLLPSGTYFYQLTVAGKSRARKLALIH